MQKLAEICIRRPIFASMIILALVVVGSAAYRALAVDRFPSVDLPTVSVRVTLQGATPDLMETEVTKLVEDAVNTVQGISELRSVSGPGTVSVTATFELNRNIDVAAQDVRDRMATITRDLQLVGADPPVIRKFNNDDAPIMTVALAGPRSQKELGEIADKIVREQLERASGVGDVAIVGGLQRAMNISIDADKLAAYQLPVTTVRDAILRQNADLPGGNLTNAQQERTVRLPGRLETAEQFNNIVIAKKNGEVIRLKDVGIAEDDTKERRSFSLLNGQPTVVLEVRRQSGENTVATIRAAKAKLDQIQAELPSDVRMEIIRDQSRYIESALHEINLHLVLGSVFASLVVLAFMGNWRSTLIAAVAIPTSVISTFGLMWWLGFTLNSVTMLALVLMVGVVIDDAIVVLENIFRFIEEKKMNPFDAAREATREIGLAVLATTLSLVVIFVPVSFMSSISGRFLYQFGITAAAAVLISLLVSFTLTPMMSARLLKPAKESHGSSRRGFYHWIDTGYTWLLKLSMRWRWGVAVVAVGVVAMSIPIYQRVKQEYVPSDVDEAEFQITFQAPEGASVGAMEEAMAIVEPEVRNTRGVTTVLTGVGAGFLGQVNTANMYVRIEPHEKRLFSFGRLLHETLAGHPMAAFQGNYAQRDVIADLRAKLAKYRNQLKPSVSNYPSFNIGGGSFDVEFVIKGAELTELSKYAEKLRNMTLPGPDGQAEIPGLVGINTTLQLDKPELQIHVDRARAADLGIAPADVGEAVRLLIGGDERVSRFEDPQLDEAYDVQMRLMQKDRLRPEQLETLYLPRQSAGGNAGTLDSAQAGDVGNNLIEFSNIASLVTVPTASRIDRLDRQRAVSVRGSVAPGFAQADRIQALRDAAAKLNLPPGYTTTVTGKARELERTFREFLLAFALSVVFMYIILASQYESLVHPFTILLSLPLSVPFALLSLYWSGNTLNLYSALGILVLFGVVKKNAILQIDHMNQLRNKGYNRADAIIQGNRDRLRPILMTTLALVAGMMPLWLGTGPGAEERRAVAVVVIGGQSLSLLLTLLVTPVVYSLLDDLGSVVTRSRGVKITAPIVVTQKQTADSVA